VPFLSDKEAFIKEESLLFNNSAVALSTAAFCSVMVIVILPLLVCPKAKTVNKLHNSTKENFLMVERFPAKKRRKRRIKRLNYIKASDRL
jgi:hypothetical protein